MLQTIPGCIGLIHLPRRLPFAPIGRKPNNHANPTFAQKFGTHHAERSALWVGTAATPHPSRNDSKELEKGRSL